MRNSLRSLLLTSALLLSASPLVLADTPALTSFSGGDPATSSSDQLYGWIFTANTNLTVTSLGVYDYDGASGLSVSHDVGIYDQTTQTLLGSATVPAGTGGTLLDGWEYESVTSFTLDAGDNYVIVMTMPEQNSDFQYVLSASETTASEITYVNSAFDAGSSLAFPNPAENGVFAQGLFGPNFTFSDSAATPEPATYGPFALGLIALAGVAFRARKASAISPQ
jgi:hypothetical protein